MRQGERERERGRNQKDVCKKTIFQPSSYYSSPKEIQCQTQEGKAPEITRNVEPKSEAAVEYGTVKCPRESTRQEAINFERYAPVTDCSRFVSPQLPPPTDEKRRHVCKRGQGRLSIVAAAASKGLGEAVISIMKHDERGPR